MRLCTFTLPGMAPDNGRAGLIEGSRVLELSKQQSVIELLERGTGKGALPTSGADYALEEVILRAPIPRPGKILATIVNARGMLGGNDVTLDRPRVDMKAPSAVIGPGEVIRAPAAGIRPEVELAAVVGRRMTSVGEDEALSSIFGYTILNDVTAPSDSREDAYEAYRRDRGSGEIRRVTLRGPLFRSKNHDTFCPMGPWICTPEEVDDWTRLKMRTRFEGQLVQDGSTSEYIFTAAKIASYISGFLTLHPGDVVSCGSIGWTREALGKFDPTEFVLPKKSGTLKLEVEGLGELLNPVSYSPQRFI